MDGIVIDQRFLARVLFDVAFVAVVLAIAVGFIFPRTGRKVLAWFTWLAAALTPLGVNAAYCFSTEQSGGVASIVGFLLSGLFMTVWLVALGFEVQPTDGGTGGPRA